MNYFQDSLKSLVRTLEDCARSADFTAAVDRLLHDATTCASGGGTFFFAGNGGSFADAQHLSAELVGTMGSHRAPISSILLGANSSTLTAIANDYSWEEALAREFEALYTPPDLLIALSTSGNSKNIIHLVTKAHDLDATCWVLTGSTGGRLAEISNVVRVPNEQTERIQEVHGLLGHVLCRTIEQAMQLQPIKSKSGKAPI